ncbi:Cytosolic iron-sulfur protein assembly protein [Maudiozyma exigua]|uniref:Probable cytosolic iron-sulfur protein assembly protein 1 n=1 Tax=Maudiozyma exigua TaxID=34358 RepID=A0A9P6W754_MAUEX|nr:Cytosolic iron-sulfur protein assembly protein [Kazachstania exigua]
MSITLAKGIKLQNDKTWSLDYKCTPFSNLLAVASTDRKIKILNIKPNGTKLEDVLDGTVHRKAVRSVAWRPNTDINTATLAAGSFDSTVSIWTKEIVGNDQEMDDESMDEEGIEMDLLAIIEGHENEVKCVAWSFDGNLLATCSRDKSVWIWETDEMGEEYECVSVLQEHSQDVKHVVWHPSRSLLASSSYDDTIRLWKEYDDDWECVAVLTGHEGTVWSSDFEGSNTDQLQEDEIRLVSVSDDSTARVWKYVEEDEENDGQQVWICQSILPKVHANQVYSVSWSPISGRIATSGSDGTLVIYQESERGSGTFEVVAQKELCHGVYEVNIVKWIDVEGKEMIATGGDDGYVNLWNINE